MLTRLWTEARRLHSHWLRPSKAGWLSLSAWLLLIMLGIAGAYVLSQLATYPLGTHKSAMTVIGRFDLNGEGAIPSWFSTILLFIAAVLLGIVANYYGSRGLPYAKHWLGLSILFIYASLDEGSGVHELGNLLMIPGRIGLGPEQNRIGWTIPAVIMVVVFLFIYRSFWLNLPRRLKILTLASAAIYLGGAIGIEFLTMAVDWITFIPSHHLVYTALILTEESMEMLGCILLIYALSEHIDQLHIISFKPTQQT